jgi:hypothetical protein
MIWDGRYRLEPPAAEAEFRAATQAADRRVAIGLAIVSMVFIVATVPATFALRDDPARLHLVWGIRVVAFGAAAATFGLLRRTTSARSYDQIITAWIATWIGAIIAENALLPATISGFIAWDVFITVAVYAAIPLGLSRQAALATFLSVGDLIVLSQFKTLSPSLSLVDIALAFTSANIVGAFVSRERHVLRRRTFTSLRSETQARSALERALQEVRTLQGIIPICAHCKNVRTDAGEWQQVEAYVRAHSDAKFSHGICPSCMAKHYPDIPAD